MKIETIAIHAGNRNDESSKAVIQPITLSTTFTREADGSFPAGYIYSRSSNPNRTSLENVLAKLEVGVDAAAFSSGNAAGMAVFQSLKPGTHIIGPDDMSMVDIVVRFRFANWRCDERKLWRRAGLLQFLCRHMKPAIEMARFPPCRARGFGTQPEMLANSSVDASRA